MCFSTKTKPQIKSNDKENQTIEIITQIFAIGQSIANDLLYSLGLINIDDDERKRTT